MDGIEIPREVADAEGVPDDLDSGVVGPYEFPSPTRRTTAAIIYLLAAAVAATGALVGLPDGMWVVAAAFVLLAVIHRLAAFRLQIDQGAALDAAGALVDFTVGHASAALAFRGWRARPVWNVILYSAADPPDRRALVQLDGVSGAQLAEVYEEPVQAATGT